MAESVVKRGTRETSSPSATRPYLRMALRGLIVAGFAGGIWLLSGSAAHAAGSHAGSHAAGSHAAGSHAAGSHAAPDSTGPVTNLVTGVGGDGVGGILGLRPVRSVVPDAGSLIAPTGSGSPAGTPGGAPSGPVAGLLGPGEDPSIDPPTGLLAPVTAAIRGSVTQVAGPPLFRPGLFRAPVRVIHRAAAGTAVGRRGRISVLRPAATPTGAPATNAAGIAVDGATTAAPTAATHPAGRPSNQRGSGDRHVHRRVAGRDHHPSRVHRADHIGSRHGPVQPERAPFPAYPDLGLLPAGASTSGSVSPALGGGAVAVAPTTATGTTGASRRSLPARDVEVRRLVAETPTVSPD